MQCKYPSRNVQKRREKRGEIRREKRREEEKEIREKNSLTQEQLAQKISVSRQSIISIEKGHYVPTTILALKIATALKVTMEELFTLEKGDW